uniref:hypothetical protein n=1 Tax=Nonomuraea sp. CA-251285 TaxID=3240002 RepID=UPI003F496885
MSPDAATLSRQLPGPCWTLAYPGGGLADVCAPSAEAIARAMVGVTGSPVRRPRPCHIVQCAECKLGLPDSEGDRTSGGAHFPTGDEATIWATGFHWVLKDGTWWCRDCSRTWLPLTGLTAWEKISTDPTVHAGYCLNTEAFGILIADSLCGADVYHPGVDAPRRDLADVDCPNCQASTAWTERTHA